MILNTQINVCTDGQHINSFKLQINYNPIGIVYKFAFLCFVIENKLNRKWHINYVVNNLNITLYCLNRLKQLCPQIIVLTLYNTLIVQHNKYGLVLIILFISIIYCF